MNLPMKGDKKNRPRGRVVTHSTHCLGVYPGIRLGQVIHQLFGPKNLDTHVTDMLHITTAIKRESYMAKAMIRRDVDCLLRVGHMVYADRKLPGNNGGQYNDGTGIEHRN